MRMIDEVGLKEKPEDTRYIKRLHQNETEAPGVWAKDLTRTLPLSGTANSGMGRFITARGVLGGGEIYTQAQHLTRDGWLYWDHSPKTPNLLRIIYNEPPTPPPPPQEPPSCLSWHVGWGASIITQIPHGYHFTRPPSRSRVYFCPSMGL